MIIHNDHARADEYNYYFNGKRKVGLRLVQRVYNVLEYSGVVFVNRVSGRRDI